MDEKPTERTDPNWVRLVGLFLAFIPSAVILAVTKSNSNDKLASAFIFSLACCVASSVMLFRRGTGWSVLFGVLFLLLQIWEFLFFSDARRWSIFNSFLSITTACLEDRVMARTRDQSPLRRIKFGCWGLLWGSAPIPIGLSIGPREIFQSLDGRGSLHVIYLIVAILCCSVAGVGQLGGFKTRRAADIMLGVFLGCAFGVVNFIVVFFAGGCSSFYHLN